MNRVLAYFQPSVLAAEHDVCGNHRCDLPEAGSQPPHLAHGSQGAFCLKLLLNNGKAADKIKLRAVYKITDQCPSNTPKPQDTKKTKWPPHRDRHKVQDCSRIMSSQETKHDIRKPEKYREHSRLCIGLSVLCQSLSCDHIRWLVQGKCVCYAYATLL